MSAPTLSRTPDRSPDSPPALRATRPGWRDPRLAFGIGVVALCALLGARLLGSADDTVGVWTLRSDGVAGQEIGSEDLEPARIRFGSADDADRYVAAGDELPAGSVLLRDAAAGELLPRAAVGSGADANLLELPVTAPVQAVPATLSVGDTADVWVTPRNARDAVLALEGVRVLALPSGGSSLSAAADRQVIVGLDDDQQRGLPEALGLLAEGTVVVTSRIGR